VPLRGTAGLAPAPGSALGPPGARRATCATGADQGLGHWRARLVVSLHDL